MKTAIHLRYFVVVTLAAAGYSFAGNFIPCRGVPNPTNNFSPALFSKFQTYGVYGAIAYCPLEKTAQWKCDKCDLVKGTPQEVYTFADDFLKVQGFIAVNNFTSQIVMSFRGSHEDINWVSNLDIALTSLKTVVSGAPSNVLVHDGFKLAYNSVRPQIKDVMINLVAKYDNYSLLFTGHSSGGAMATLAAVDGVFGYGNSSWGPRTTIVTLGEPRLGNQDFLNLIKKASFADSVRFINNKDPVPHLPPFGTTKIGYVHHPTEVWLDLNGQPFLCDDTYDKEEDNCANTYWLCQTDFNDHHGYFGMSFDTCFG